MPGDLGGPFEPGLELPVTDATPVVFNLGAWPGRRVEVKQEGSALMRFRFAADSESSPTINLGASTSGDSFAPIADGGTGLGASEAVFRAVQNGYTQLVIQCKAAEPATVILITLADLPRS